RFAAMLKDAGKSLAPRHPDEAEKLWDESITLWKEINGPSPRLRDYADQLGACLVWQAQLLRRLGTASTGDGDSEVAVARRTKAEARFQELITLQRQIVSRFGLSRSRYDLVQYLHEEAAYLLKKPADA